MRASAGRGQMVSALVDAAAVVAAWAGALVAENVALAFLWREQFSGAWEVSIARHFVAPIALAAFAPVSLLVVAAFGLSERAAAGSATAARGLALIGAVAFGAVALGVTTGRHFDNWAIRAPFVLALAAGGAFAGALVVPRIAALSDRPIGLALLGLVVAVAAWLADDYVLPRLYPAFHVAMLASVLLGAALVGLALRAGSNPGIAVRLLALLVGVGVALCAAWAPHAIRELDRMANVRIALVEHGPLLGPAVILAARLHPPAVEDSASLRASPALAAPGEVARSLDWTSHDLVLLSVDALRADHVSAYGYGRQTTPNIDALAREGTLFERAYCPTPHTSYSISSMLTGKYLRPLLSMGLGEDSETWAQDLRHYGWHTAAFYPPAVFFIDESRFTRFEQEHLGFEYAKVEFADTALREAQVADYLETASKNAPLFLWVHFFEPHEPYVAHPDHVFAGSGSPDIDAYDGEVAAADEGVGRVLRLIRARRPGAIVIATADHGEEFGEHGGRYHGTTVYEEQVRVPLVIVGPNVRKDTRVAAVVQTIDVLPTALSALGIPRPARVRGRDLGPLLAGEPMPEERGFAFAETDDYALIASGRDRLVCERRAAACALYRPDSDPLERHDLGPADPSRFSELRGMLRAVERDHGQYEASDVSAWPEALRRAMQGEIDAAPDVAPLLDDASVAIRRKAAEMCFALRDPVVLSAARRALKHDEDDEVRRWEALALVRLGDPIPDLGSALLRDPDRDWRHRAALALGERGDARGCDELAAWWNDLLPPPGERRDDGEPPRLALDLQHVGELLAATSRARCRRAVPALVHALSDVRARPY
ncbi:MAG: sulfatase-like hydrolase/transferase, partial [Myxococcota bacterium]|nr:sulfatase-like hydrolase/transferase [Myxococcota bacterium]